MFPRTTLTTAPEMKNHRHQPSSDDHPLAANEFFRRAEAPVESQEEADWGEEEEVLAEGESADAMPDDRPQRSFLAIGGFTVAALGVALTGASVVLGPSVDAVLAPLAAAGFTPFAVAVAGLITASLGSLRAAGERRAAETNWRMDQLEQSLLTLSPGQSEQIDEAGHILVALQRQDEKLNNLTRATKLYGKPLAEVTEQVHEIAQGQSKLDLDVANLERAMHAATSASEAHLAERLEDLARTVRELQEAVASSQNTTDTKGSWTREEAREDLADAVTQVRTALRELDAPAAPQPVVLDGLEDAVVTIQREIQSLATSLSRIESQRPTASAAPTPAEAGPATQPTISLSKTPTPSQGPVGDLAQSIAGERKAKGRNVLGAIAKLKSMRS